MDNEGIAQVLEAAEMNRSPVGPVSEMVEGGLSLEAAYGIMESLIGRRRERGEEIAGYKVGFTNRVVRDKLGLPDSTYGYIMDSMVLMNGSRVHLKDLIAPKIECEICFKLKKDLHGKDSNVETVLDATAGVAASFEICDSRIKDWRCPYPDFFADNGFSARVVLTGDWKPVSAIDLMGEEVALYQDGREIARGKGEMAMGHPARAISWLAGKLYERGRGLMAGQIVMTGTLTPIQPVLGPTSYRAHFSTLGDVRVDFV
jgi:2-keto-4-pentenoate hydratase